MRAAEQQMKMGQFIMAAVKERKANMSTLYEINNDIQSLQDGFNNGEIPEEAFNGTLEGLKMEYYDKVENICKLVKNLEADAASCKAEADRLTEKAKVLKANAQHWKDYIKACMDSRDEQKIKAGTFNLRIGTSTSVNIIDESKLTEKYLKIKTEVSKTAISADLKAGIAVDGAELVSKQSLYIK